MADDRDRSATGSRYAVAGILAERNQITPSEPFERLRKHSRHTQSRIHDVATQVVDGTPNAVTPQECAETPAPSSRRRAQPGALWPVGGFLTTALTTVSDALGVAHFVRHPSPEEQPAGLGQLTFSRRPGSTSPRTCLCPRSPLVPRARRGRHQR